MWKTRDDPQTERCRSSRRDEADANVYDEKRTENLVRQIGIATCVGCGEVSHEPAAVSEIEQLKVIRHRRDEHPEAVICRAEMPDRVGHQNDAESDVHGEKEVLGRRPSYDVFRRRAQIDGWRRHLVSHRPSTNSIAPDRSTSGPNHASRRYPTNQKSRTAPATRAFSSPLRTLRKTLAMSRMACFQRYRGAPIRR